jgi:tetratricopeptide (TPR) repeat protein
MPEVVDALPVVPLGAADWGEAARLLEQAVKAGNHDPQTTYLLAMGYKHLGRVAEARQVLDKIADADANVLLQRGILAFSDRDYGQAAQGFAQSWQSDPASYPAAYNLLLARLCQGQHEACIQSIPQIIPLAGAPEERRFLEVLRALLVIAPRPGSASPDHGSADDLAILSSISAEEETHLVNILGGLGSFDVVYPLLNQLMAARPQSKIAFGAYFGAALMQGKLLMDRFQWYDAYALLASLARKLEDGAPPPVRRSPEPDDDGAMHAVAHHTMLGTCSCMLQDFERGAWYFRNAQQAFDQTRGNAATLSKKRGGSRRPERILTNPDARQAARLEQNLALAYEWQNKLDKAENHWNRYFDYLEQIASASNA